MSENQKNTNELTGKRIFMISTLGVVGGTQVSVINLSRALRERGHFVSVGFGEGQFLERECLASEIPFRRFSNLKRSLNPFLNLSFLWSIKKMFDAEGYDVIHINSSNTLFAAIGAKLSKNKPKVVFTFRGLSVLDEAYKNKLTRFFYRLVFRFFMLFVDEPVFVSRSNYQSALEKGLIKRGSVILNGLDPDRMVFFSRESARSDLQGRLAVSLENRFVVGSIGRLSYQKNYEFLVNRIAELKDEFPELLVIIIGDGEERERLTSLIIELGVENQVILAGEIPGASRYMKAFDLFSLTSRYEGLSVTLIEVLFAGIPALVSDVGGAGEQFESALFQVYPLNNTEEYQKRLKRLIDNPSIRDELAEANLQSSEKFRIDRAAREYEQVYKR